jgi:hypothetical protein
MSTFRVGQCVRIRKDCTWLWDFPSPAGLEAIVVGREGSRYEIFAPTYTGPTMYLVADAWELEPATLSPDLARQSATELTV